MVQSNATVVTFPGTLHQALTELCPFAKVLRPLRTLREHAQSALAVAKAGNRGNPFLAAEYLDRAEALMALL